MIQIIRKYLTYALCLALAFSLFVGCQSQNVTTDTKTADSKSGNSIVGQITAINGGQITLSLGTLNIGNRPDSGSNGENELQNGTDADAAATATTGADGQPGNPPNVGQSGDETPTGGSGSRPGGMGGGDFTALGEKMTITVTNDTVITLGAQRGPSGPQNESGSGNQNSPQSSGSSGEQRLTTTGMLSDLQVGDIVTVTLSGSTATAITVEPSPPDGPGDGLGKADGNQPDNATSDDNTSAPSDNVTEDAASAI